MDYRESITAQTANEVKQFLERHPDDVLDYWDWRESNQLALKVYKELEESTKGFSDEIDEILERYNVHNGRVLSDYEMININSELDKVKVICSKQIHSLLQQLEEKRYR